MIEVIQVTNLNLEEIKKQEKAKEEKNIKNKLKVLLNIKKNSR